MKKLLFGLIATVMFATVVNAKSTIEDNGFKVENVVKLKHYEGDIKLSGGCNVHYSIDANFSWGCLCVTEIHGSFTMSGNCHVTQTFKNGVVKTTKDGVITDFTSEIKDPTLTSAEFTKAFIEVLNIQKDYSK